MKTTSYAALALVCALGAAGCTSRKPADVTPDVHWQGVNLPADSTGTRHYRSTFTVTGDLRGVTRLAFNQFKRKMEVVNPADTLVELLPGYFAIGSTRFDNATGTDTIVFDLLVNGSLAGVSHTPTAAHLVKADGSTIAVNFSRKPLSDCEGSYETMPSGEEIYAFNESIRPDSARGVYDIIPSFKQVSLTGGTSTVNLADVKYEEPADANADNIYTITVAGDKMTVRAPRSMWAALRARIAHNFGNGTVELPDVIINDGPSMPYRGIMVDIVRNYRTPEEVNKIVDLMSVYGLNKLHFHVADDEGWRVEIPALPELTDVSSRRGYPLTDTDSYLPQMYFGDGDPLSSSNSGNGYFSVEDYIALVRHANELGIEVIPEIESPGHARAAVHAMNIRAAAGHPEWLLREPGDTSVYTSAQALHDNVMNPALEGPYMLIDTVADALAEMHRRAGVPLRVIHIGGDEVPSGAWSGSNAVKELMARENLASESEVHDYFVRRVNDILAKKGIKMSGWQEIALDRPVEFNKEVIPNTYSVNCWTQHGGREDNVLSRVARAGFPSVLSNVDYLYFDQAYSPHPDEPGLSWGGYTDEFTALHAYPARLCGKGLENVIGLSAQLFAETFGTDADLKRMLVPKILGLAERAWNPDSTYTDRAFNAVLTDEIPKWEAAGFAYHVRQPGIHRVDPTHFTVNSPYAGNVVIRYTLDGTRPDENSPVAKPGEPVAFGDASQIKAILWLNSHPSHVTILKLK